MDARDPESIRIAEQYLAEEGSVILAVLPVSHVFDDPLPITLAKKVGIHALLMDEWGWHSLREVPIILCLLVDERMGLTLATADG